LRIEPLGPDLRREHLSVSTYRRCYITHSGIAVRRFWPVGETLFDEIPAATSRRLYLYAWYKYVREPRIRSSLPDLLLAHNHWSSGYHHWITEVLVKLKFAPVENHTIVVPEDYPRFAFESLEMMGASKVFKLPADHGLEADHLTVVENPISGHFHHDHLAWLRERLLPHRTTSTASARVYISRRGEKLRRIENEDEVVAALEHRGFSTVDTAAMTFGQQLSLFAGCSTLVSIHGAGLTNCLFMPRGAAVVELYRALTPEHPGMNPCYRRQSTALGLRHHYVFCAHERNLGKHIDRTNIRVDVRQLGETLDRIDRGD